MSMPSLTLLAGGAALALAAPMPAAQDEAPRFADELPGYYQFYKREGDSRRLPQEVARDSEMEAGDAWAAAELELTAPDWKLPDADGALLPLAVGGEGRITVVTTFQAWW